MAGRKSSKGKKVTGKKKAIETTEVESESQVQRSNDSTKDVTEIPQVLPNLDVAAIEVPIKSSRKRKGVVKKKQGENSECETMGTKRSKVSSLEVDDQLTTEAVFQDGEDLVTIVARGQDTDFKDSSDEEEGEIIDDAESEVTEVTFRCPPRSTNNNATLPSAQRANTQLTREFPRDMVTDAMATNNDFDCQNEETVLTQNQLLSQIQALMTKGGFDETAKFLEKKLKEEMKEKERKAGDPEATVVPVGSEKDPKGNVISSVVMPARVQNRKTPTKPKRSERSPSRGIRFSQDDVESEITIYKNAVAMAGQTSSSEEVMTSDEGLRLGISDDSNDTDNVQNEIMVSQFVDMQCEQDRRRRGGHETSNNRQRRGCATWHVGVSSERSSGRLSSI